MRTTITLDINDDASTVRFKCNLLYGYIKRVIRIMYVETPLTFKTNLQKKTYSEVEKFMFSYNLLILNT